MKVNLTDHVVNDRLDRITAILTTVGVGEVVYKFQESNQYGPNVHCITNTGVIIIKDAYEDKIITMFMLTERRLFAYWKTHMVGRPPQYLVKLVGNNQKKRRFLFDQVLTNRQQYAIIKIQKEKGIDTMNITINFDMDGTIANLYGVENWLAYLEAEDTFPYANAEPLLRLCTRARKLNALQKQGYNLAVISWLSKCGSDEYNEAVTAVKMAWLAKHLPSVNWDAIHIVPYGTPKQNFCGNPLDILFDDEERNRNNWTGRAYDVQNIMEILREI